MSAQESAQTGSWTVVVLTGGSSSRMGQDKASLDVAGVSMLERTLGGVPQDIPVVAAGPPLALTRSVTFVREEPPGGGPVAGLEAAMEVVRTPIVVVLATDLPFVDRLPSQLASRLAASGDDVDAVVAVDADGRRQQLCSAYRSSALRDAMAAGGVTSGASMRSVVERLRVQTVPAAEAVRDVDTPNDLETARAAFERRTPPASGSSSIG